MIVKGGYAYLKVQKDIRKEIKIRIKDEDNHIHLNILTQLVKLMLEKNSSGDFLLIETPKVNKENVIEVCKFLVEFVEKYRPDYELDPIVLMGANMKDIFSNKAKEEQPLINKEYIKDKQHFMESLSDSFNIRGGRK